MGDLLAIGQVVVVITLVVTAAALATPPGRVPLALRGIQKILRRDTGKTIQGTGLRPAPLWRRVLAFALVILALLICYA